MIARLRSSLRERGAQGTISRILGSLREGLDEEEMLVMTKDLEEIVVPRHLDRLQVEELDRSHLQGLREVNRRRGMPQADTYMENSLDSGFHGFVAISDGDLVGYYWWVDRTNRPSHPDAWRLGKGFKLGPGDVYGGSLFLLDEFRGEGRADEFLFRIESALRDLGYTRIWGYVEKGNRAARWMYRVHGYRPVRWVRVRRLGLIRWRRSSDISDGD